ncbi:S-methyl-5'-thioadenosine phosphorylase [Endomicrobiia bacterium]|nr:S-methyl-5'-thioadenosine phosphorylase [Candidatus Endomicrobium trichonymphae]GHT05904.1 S-methyl-5'-thioadenosine phosphorylase [Endomicrobiia bacterium]BAV58870.1 S-methyl-5'-thioadenosine phosphorylase [Candidatus Endomicrobium trichonymphae]GHT08644.1 S-methyl-5'-thioadenosine phosphorylase [Endomicrobiia bacterium]GHT11773.1 S-methyl-5'-thioadenosine phosphorylase [Endomicrobiia bacterium]GHT15647.1 S-methyl-5'-thioadenosine phosphorylase [Endomicrobiia bacterium]
MEMSDNPIKIAFIGGSGLYQIDGIENIVEKDIDTPFGRPSDKIITGVINRINCAFLPRHGRGHILNPSEINQRANIYALKSLGTEQIVSFTACGSLKEEIKPKDFVIPDQVFDRTKNRSLTFFEKGIVAHVSMAYPFCNEIRSLIRQTVYEIGIKYHFCGTYVCIEGPQFSTKAESQINRQSGFSVVGMTLFPEAKLAREAEICYANISLVTDFDVWKEREEVTNDAVVANVAANVANSRRVIKSLILKLSRREIKCSCGSSLKKSLMTSSDRVTVSPHYKNVSLLIDKYFKK